MQNIGVRQFLGVYSCLFLYVNRWTENEQSARYVRWLPDLPGEQKMFITPLGYHDGKPSYRSPPLPPNQTTNWNMVGYWYWQLKAVCIRLVRKVNTIQKTNHIHVDWLSFPPKYYIGGLSTTSPFFLHVTAMLTYFWGVRGHVLQYCLSGWLMTQWKWETQSWINDLAIHRQNGQHNTFSTQQNDGETL